MKKILYLLVIVFIAGFTADAKPANPPAGFGIFFSTLNPHGAWMEMSDGLVVWRPTIIRTGWAPYREGRWIWTVDGWYWDSYEPFGHVTYHYGRWFYDDYYGWIWVPDYEWAPAWVEWRYDDVYIGWAPLPPYAVFSINIGIHYTYDYYTPYSYWHFVNYSHFDDPYVYNHFVGNKYKNRIYSRTKYRTNYGYYDGRVVNRGVDVDYVRERSGRDFKTRDIERVRDYSQVGSTRDRGNNEKIRTLYVPKDELLKERDINRESIKRADKKSSLDVSRVEIGERNVRSNDKNRETVVKDRKDANVRDNKVTNDRNVGKVNTGTRNERIAVQKRNDDNGKAKQNQEVRVNRENVRTPQQNVEKSRTQQKQERPVVSGRSNQTERVTRPEVRNQAEVKRQNDVRKQAEVQRQAEVRKQNDVRKQAEVKRQADVKKQNERVNRTEVRTQSNNTPKREVKRTETRKETQSNTRVERNNSGSERTKTKNRTR